MKHWDGTSDGPSSCVVMSTVEPERVEWLWEGRIAAGKLSMLDGDPGLGKSFLTLRIAAAVTTGTAIIEGERPVPLGAVLILAAEDGLADTIRPRLEAASADLTKVVALTDLPDSDGEPRPIVLPTDVAEIEDAIRAHGVTLVVIDPITAFLASDVDAHKDQDVRRALLQLAKMAERTGAAVILVRHLRKSGVGNAVHAGGGSIAFIGAARTGLLVARDPENPDARILAVTKCNLAAEAKSRRYKLVDNGCGVARLEWLAGDCTHRADDLIANRQEDEPGAVAEAMDLIQDVLKAGPVPSKDLDRAGEAAGISRAAMKRGRARLGVKAFKGKGSDKAWMVSMSPLNTLSPLDEKSNDQEAHGAQEVQGVRLGGHERDR